MKNEKGFTLIEITFIIIIVGFLLGIFLNANMVLKNAEIKAFIVQLEKYNTAITIFKKKYGQMPGDLKKTVIFGLSEKNTDGDENGIIEDLDSVKKIKENSIEKSTGEISNFWMHLTNSGFLDEIYDGNSGFRSRIGRTYPITKINNTGIIVFGVDGKNYYHVGAFKILANSKFDLSDSSLKPFEAFLIDKKIDDGIPRTGNVVVSGSDGLNDTTNIKKECATVREYLTRVDIPTCQLRIRIIP